MCGNEVLVILCIYYNTLCHIFFYSLHSSIAREAIKRWSEDNISIVIQWLKDPIAIIEAYKNKA